MRVTQSVYIVVLSLICLVFTSCNTGKNAGKRKTNSEQVVLSQEQAQQFSTLFLDATREKILGNFDLALQIYQKTLEIDPSSAAAKYEIARIHAQAGNYTHALPFAKSAYESEPENIWYAEFLGQLYAELGQLDQSASVFEEIIEKNPESYDYYFTLGNLLSAQGKFDEALKLYNDLDDKLGLSEELTLQRQVIYLDKGDYESALAEVNQLIEASPNEVRFIGMKAEILGEMGREDEAIQIYKDLLEAEPENGLVLVSLYEIYLKQGNTTESNGYLIQAFGSAELNIDVKINILLNYMAGPEFVENKDLLVSLTDNLVKAHPTDAKSHAVRGDLYYNFAEYEKARESFRAAVELDANRPPIWQQIVTIDSQLSDFEAMKTESAEAMELFPQQPIFYLFNGIALLQSKETEAAIEVLTTGKNLVVDNIGALAQFYSSLGDAYHEIGNNKKSDSAYEMSLKYDPSNVVVLNNYAYYLSLRKVNLEHAEAMAKKANNLSPNQATFQDTYAWVLYCRDNYQNALFWIEEALKYGGDTDPVVYEHYGDILLKVNRIGDAAAAWQKAIELGGDTEMLQSKIDTNKP